MNVAMNLIRKFKACNSVTLGMGGEGVDVGGEGVDVEGMGGRGWMWRS